MTSTVRRAALALLILVSLPIAAHASQPGHAAFVEPVAPAPMSTLQPVPGPVEVAHPAAPATRAADPVPSAPDTPWHTLALVGLAALGGIEMVLRGLRTLLGIIAPRTKTTADDRIGDAVARLDDFMLEVRDALAGVAKTAPAEVQTESEKPTAPGRVMNLGGLGVMLVVLLAGAAQTSCTHDQRVAATHALWNCTSPARADLVTATTPLAVSAIKLATNPDGSIDSVKLKAFFKPANLLSEAGVVISCAAVEAFEVLRSAASRQTLLVGAGASPDALDAAEVALREPWGGATFQLADGVR